MPSKIRGRLIGRHEGIEIYVTPNNAKTQKGKDRVWIQIRQRTPKKWRVQTTLSYAKASDIMFIKEL